MTTGVELVVIRVFEGTRGDKIILSTVAVLKATGRLTPTHHLGNYFQNVGIGIEFVQKLRLYEIWNIFAVDSI